MADPAGARTFRRAGADAQDAGTHRAHAQDRQAAAQLSDDDTGHTDMSKHALNKQVQDAYIVAATRTPVGKAPRGVFRNTRPDDMLAHVIRAVMAQAPGIDPHRIGDVIVGCAMPEAEQGMNVARIGLLLAGLPDTVPGVTVNRFCSSGLQAVAMAADRIRLGEADLMIAAGTESMSMVPMMGHKVAMNP